MYMHIFRDATNTKETQKRCRFFFYDKSLYAMMTNLQVDMIIRHANLCSDIFLFVIHVVIDRKHI